MKKILAKFIWNFTEFFNIDLGEFAPVCLGWMIGAKPKEITNSIDKEGNQCK